MSPAPAGPLGLRTPAILESRGGAGIDREETKIETEGEMIVGIIAVMNRLIETGIEGETIAGDPRGIVIGAVRGADVTGGGVMIADRLIHEGCGRYLRWLALCGDGDDPPAPLRRGVHE